MVRKSKVAGEQAPWAGLGSKAVHPLELIADGGDILNATQFHVLAVDDSTVDRKLIERLLKNSSYKVTVVDSAVRALEVLGLAEGRSSSLNTQSFQFNLIITDYCMPSMTGYDLLKKVKETSSLREIPVVIMSSENVRSRIDDCKAEGAEDFILKPVQLEDVKRLRGFIRQSSTSPRPAASALSSSGNSGNAPAPACSKRKIAPESPHAGRQMAADPDRRTRFSTLNLH